MSLPREALAYRVDCSQSNHSTRPSCRRRQRILADPRTHSDRTSPGPTVQASSPLHMTRVLPERRTRCNRETLILLPGDTQRRLTRHKDPPTLQPRSPLTHQLSQSLDARLADAADTPTVGYPQRSSRALTGSRSDNLPRSQQDHSYSSLPHGLGPPSFPSCTWQRRRPHRIDSPELVDKRRICSPSPRYARRRTETLAHSLWHGYEALARLDAGASSGAGGSPEISP